VSSIKDERRSLPVASFGWESDEIRKNDDAQERILRRFAVRRSFRVSISFSPKKTPEIRSGDVKHPFINPLVTL